MATISIDIPTAALPRIKAMMVINAPIAIPNSIPKINGNTPKPAADWTAAELSALVKALIAKFILDLVKAVEADAAAKAASAAAITKVDTDGLVV